MLHDFYSIKHHYISQIKTSMFKLFNNLIFRFCIGILLTIQAVSAQQAIGYIRYKSYLGSKFDLESLYFNNHASLSISGAKKPSDDTPEEESTTKVSINFGREEGERYLKNISEKRLTMKITLPGSRNQAAYIEDSLEVIPWKLGESQKMCGSLLCLNATGTFKGRNYEAWFAPDIPVSTGPWKLWGLPGAILEAQDDTGEVKFLFEVIEMPPKSNQEITLPYTPDAKRMTYNQYKMQIKLLSDRIQQFLINKIQEGGGNIVSASTNFFTIEKDF